MDKPASNQEYAFSPLRAYLIIFLYFFATTPSLSESIARTTLHTQVSQDFIVSIKYGLVSVKATEAPLKDIIQRIGQALGIEVEARIRDQAKSLSSFRISHWNKRSSA